LVCIPLKLYANMRRYCTIGHIHLYSWNFRLFDCFSPCSLCLSCFKIRNTRELGEFWPKRWI